MSFCEVPAGCAALHVTVAQTGALSSQALFQMESWLGSWCLGLYPSVLGWNTCTYQYNLLNELQRGKPEKCRDLVLGLSRLRLLLPVSFWREMLCQGGCWLKNVLRKSWYSCPFLMRAGSAPSAAGAPYLVPIPQSMCFPSTLRNVAIGTHSQVFIPEAVHVS